VTANKYSRSFTSSLLGSSLSELVKQTENDLEMIRFCTSDYKQRDEALDAVNALCEKLNITI
jgi:hypothetical protein